MPRDWEEYPKASWKYPGRYAVRDHKRARAMERRRFRVEDLNPWDERGVEGQVFLRDPSEINQDFVREWYRIKNTFKGLF